MSGKVTNNMLSHRTTNHFDVFSSFLADITDSALEMRSS